MSFQQQQYLHSSVIPRLTMVHGQQKAPRPLSDATSIASSTDFEDEMHFMAHTKVSRPPVYKYTQVADMDLMEEDVEDVEDESPTIEGETIDALFNKTQRMNTWLSVSDGRNSCGSDVKTISSYDEATTPKTPPTEFIPRKIAGKSMTMGPRGPHLFRSLSTGSAGDFPYEEDEYVTPISPINPSALPFGTSTEGTPDVSAPESDVSDIEDYEADEADHSPHYDVNKPDIRLDVNYRPMSAISMALEDVEETEVENWSTLQVCNWMQKLRFEETLITKFQKNDITGAILMQLQWEDLKDLDISSFGKRVELWSEMNHLRKSPQLSNTSPARSTHGHDALESPRALHSPPILSRHASKKSRESNWSKGSSDRSSPTVRQSNGSFLTTPKFASIYEAEHQMPESPSREYLSPPLPYEPEVPDTQAYHHDSEEYTSTSDVEDEYDQETEAYQDQPTLVMPSLQSRRGRAVPALALARSRENMKDARKSTNSQGQTVFAASNPTKRRVRISPGLMSPLSPSPRVIDICFEEAFTPAPRRVSMLAPSNTKWGATAPVVQAPSICASSDVLAFGDKPSMALKSDDLRKVSMLTAQEQVNKFLTLQHLQSLEERVHSPPPSRQLQEQVSLPSHLVSPRQVPLPPTPSESMENPSDYLEASAIQRSMSMRTPSNKKLQKANRTLTTIIPPSQVSSYDPSMNQVGLPSMPQNTVQNVSNRSVLQSPSYAPTGSQLPSKATPTVSKTRVIAVHEDQEWEDTSSGPPSPTERIFSGEIKKRSNNWLRHEWTTHHAELRGTCMSIYRSASSRELMTTIEMDDYTVTCTSNNANKFGRSLKSGSKKDSDGSYTFQLVPIKKLGDPKKEYNFATGTREERFEWMRALMLSKALKQKTLGFQVEVNGKMM